jgi:hypothetical protein
VRGRKVGVSELEGGKLDDKGVFISVGELWLTEWGGGGGEI